MNDHPTLLVADPKQREAFRSALGGPVVELDDYLQAMGQMAHEPAAAVIGTVDPLEAQPAATARVLRRMAPRARMLLLAESDQEPIAQQAVAEGFDDYAVRPLDEKWLRQRLEHVGPTTETLGTTQTSALPESPWVPPLAGVGDQFLLEVIASGGDLKSAALTLIQRRTGDATCRWQSDVEEGSVRVGLVDEGLGHLVSASLDAAQIQPHADWLAHWLGMQQRLGQLNDMAWRDALTGAWNRRHFDQRLAQILQEAQANRHEVTLMLYDIDDFKSFNDRHGHSAGDLILQETARLMGSLVRQDDVVARVGGDEFGVIFSGPQSPGDVAQIMARFQAALKGDGFPKLSDQSLGAMTVSAGLVSYPWDGPADAEALMAEADRRLYQAKADGKDTIRLGPQA